MTDIKPIQDIKLEYHSCAKFMGVELETVHLELKHKDNTPCFGGYVTIREHVGRFGTPAFFIGSDEKLLVMRHICFIRARLNPSK